MSLLLSSVSLFSLFSLLSDEKRTPACPALPQAGSPSSSLSPSWHPPASCREPLVPFASSDAQSPCCPLHPKAHMAHDTGATVTQIKQRWGATEDFTRKTRIRTKRSSSQEELVLMSKCKCGACFGGWTQKLPCKLRLLAKLYPFSSRCAEGICFSCLFACQPHHYLGISIALQ